MSQHQVETVTKDGQGVTVTLGWDRPLGGYFALVEKKAVKLVAGAAQTQLRSDAAEDGEGDESPYVYCNLDDPELLDSYGMSPDLDYFVGVLGQLGIAVPGTMLDEVRRDGEVNAGNRYVLYDAAGSVLPCQ